MTFCVLAILITKALPKTFLLLVLVLRFLASGSKLDGSKISTFLSGQRTSEKPSVTPVGSGCKTSSCWFGKGSEPLSLFSNPQEPERKLLLVACYLLCFPTDRCARVRRDSTVKTERSSGVGSGHLPSGGNACTAVVSRSWKEVMPQHQATAHSSG